MAGLHMSALRHLNLGRKCSDDRELPKSGLFSENRLEISGNKKNRHFTLGIRNQLKGSQGPQNGKQKQRT